MRQAKGASKPFSFLTPKNVLLAMVSIIVLLIAAHLLAAWALDAFSLDPNSLWAQAMRRFDVDQEISVPTWYSQSALLVAALLAFYIGIKEKFRRKMYGAWLGLGVVLTYMSMDEGASFHELSKVPTATSLGIESGFLLSAWVIPALVLALAVGLLFVKFLLRLPRRTSGLMILSGAVFVAGSIGMEMIGAQAYTYYVVLEHESTHQTFFTIAGAIEECMEMLGVAILVYALLDYIHTYVLPAEKSRKPRKN